ncbi:unnamed protein product, partial [Lepidochelys kempii]
MAPARDRLHFRFPGYGDGVLRRMDQLRAQRRFCDVTVQVNELRVPGHRVVFAACSPFLRDQFLLSDSPEVSVSAPAEPRDRAASCCSPATPAASRCRCPSWSTTWRPPPSCRWATWWSAARRPSPATLAPRAGGQQAGRGEEEKGGPPSPLPVRRQDGAERAGDLLAGRSSPSSPEVSLQGCGDEQVPPGGPCPPPGGPWRGCPLRRRPLEPARKDRPAGLGGARKAPELERPFRCPRCEGLFPQLAGFASHVREHRLFLCLRCAKLFSQKSNLTRHLRVHSGFKPFQCPVCRKRFTQNATLQDHLNLHSGRKPHRCNYCAVHFTHKPGLRRHPQGAARQEHPAEQPRGERGGGRGPAT